MTTEPHAVRWAQREIRSRFQTQSSKWHWTRHKGATNESTSTTFNFGAVVYRRGMALVVAVLEVCTALCMPLVQRGEGNSGLDLGGAMTTGLGGTWNDQRRNQSPGR